MSVELRPHNQSAYENLIGLLETENKGAVIHPTGTGKSFIALKMIEDNPDKRIVYLSPSVPIMNQLKKHMIANDVNFRNVKRYTYQKLTSMNRNNELNVDADIIILDEFHHCGAPEWGKAVEQLLQNNENAKVIGLSATPMRYFDEEVRDMAEELFDDSVASEMTLEDAIATGILNEPIYTTGFYEYGEIVKDLEEKIDKKEESREKELAKEELQRLKTMLSASVNGLPELLEKSMTNRNGRYIVYCRDIEDMQKKMEDAQKMFAKVNTNMEIMSVSSRDEDIRENASTIRRFEKDNDEGKLKLLFSVNMLNEGYHLDKLDGVIMMRPTHSPTLYAQQLGRALSVGNEKQPIVIDLVNNIDTIEIIERFKKSLGESRKRNHTQSSNHAQSSSKFSISDDTREIRKLVDKIDSLVARSKHLTAEERLALMKEYMDKTGESIVFGTRYKGYNLGAMRSNLRAAYHNGTLQMDGELLQKFIDAGIIILQKERIRTSSQEKFDFIVSLYQKHNGNFDELLADDTQMRNGMTYSIVRNYLQLNYNRGILDLRQEQIEFLKEKGFLYDSLQEKIEKQEKAKELELPVSVINYAEKNYPSIEACVQAIKKGEDHLKVDSDFEGFKGIAISSKDISEEQKLRYANLVCEIWERKIDEISYQTGRYIDIDRIEQLLSQLTPRTEKILRMRYGIGEKANTIKTIAENYDTTEERVKQIIAEDQRIERVKQIIAKGQRIMRSTSRKNSPILSSIDERLSMCDEKIENIDDEIEILKKVKSLVFDVDGNLKENITREGLRENAIPDKYVEELFGISQVTDIRTGMIHKKYEDMRIEDLDLSYRAYNCLKRKGINTALDIFSLGGYDELFNIRNMGKKCTEEVIKKLEEKGITTVEDENGKIQFQMPSNQSVEEKTIAQMYDDRISELTNERQKLIIVRERMEKQKEVYNRVSNAYLQDENIFSPHSIVPKVDSKEQAILRLKSNEELIEHGELFNDDIASSQTTDERLDKVHTEKLDTELDKGKIDSIDSSGKNKKTASQQRREELIKSIKANKELLDKLEAELAELDEQDIETDDLDSFDDF